MKRATTPEAKLTRRLLEAKVLKLYAGNNHTYAEIANEVGVGRGVVSGIVLRAIRTGVAAPNGRIVVKPAERKPEPEVPEALPTPEPAKLLCEPVDFFEARSHHCRWLVGRLKYCGMPKAYKSFCQAHAERAYIPYVRRSNR